MPEHALTLPGLRRIPGHGTRIAALRANWSGPAIGSATAEKTTSKEQEDDEALSHAGKLADPQIVASVGIGWLLLDGSSQQSCVHDGAIADPTPSGNMKKTDGISTGLKGMK
ncbi:MAG: hypothetical protein MK194_09020 [Roseibacillus sp.]|nr:hypothetical protein [Roseibacillus sp.]